MTKDEKLEITAKMIGGVVYEGELHIRVPDLSNTCTRCVFSIRACSEFRDRARESGQLTCEGSYG